jgi:hypothetical protein
LIGTGYGLVDGAAAGWLFSWVYQAFDRTRRTYVAYPDSIPLIGRAPDRQVRGLPLPYFSAAP